MDAGHVREYALQHIIIKNLFFFSTIGVNLQRLHKAKHFTNQSHAFILGYQTGVAIFAAKVFKSPLWLIMSLIPKRSHGEMMERKMMIRFL